MSISCLTTIYLRSYDFTVIAFYFKFWEYKLKLAEKNNTVIIKYGHKFFRHPIYRDKAIWDPTSDPGIVYCSDIDASDKDRCVYYTYHTRYIPLYLYKYEIQEETAGPVSRPHSVLVRLGTFRCKLQSLYELNCFVLNMFFNIFNNNIAISKIIIDNNTCSVVISACNTNLNNKIEIFILQNFRLNNIFCFQTIW